ncbi:MULTISPECIES: glutamine synthetase family protein [Roseovarius]|uniref:glutamine synthetase family protein n=1 Tax=Roseovarius TaxID=74030 RepID=UPI001C94E85D|nr:glutamine synthetase family protein [Roseovarius atlanticus]MBY5989956.1 glutamine synthetase family protein [Roseovarius atlanticus]MBY6126501.1 glutamine synthetase family protein [Roseovarius atlanticus]MBY6150995.1 glutamine synthetase family protein [Roseovarius atlanticus]
MTPVPLIFAATCDLAGKVRGKAFPADQLDKRLVRGVGWTPTNVLINCFDGIGDSPFGALGDLLLIPDPRAAAKVDFGTGRTEHFMLGDIVTLEGEAWDFCTRAILKTALNRLHRVAGVRLISAFEHEFQLKGKPALANQAYGRESFELQREFCETLMAAVQGAGMKPDSIMKEFGPDQYEVVVGPDEGMRSADAAVILRELTRSAARAMGREATFTPIRDVTGVGNGVHIHMSFIDDDGNPVTYDENGACGMSQVTSAFSAGVLKYLENIIALTAPSVISYERLTPHRWSAAYNNLGFRDREASLRVCPVTAKDGASIAHQFNIEYRAADAAACPHLALAAIVHAGCQGIEEGLLAPDPTEEDLSLLSSEKLSGRGIVRLPTSLELALDRFEASDVATGWFGPDFAAVYRAHKMAEIAHLADMETGARCAAYEDTY